GMRGNTIQVFICPSDSYNNPGNTGNRAGGGWARGNYAANMGPGDPGATANGGSGGNYGYGRARGMMCINWGAGPQRIPDDSSHAARLAHMRVARDSNDMRGAWAFGMPACSTMANHGVGDSYGPNDTGCCSDDVTGCTDNWQDRMGCWSGGYGQGT